MKTLLNFLLRKLKKDPAYALDPLLSTGDLLAMLGSMALALLRGMWLRWRLKSVQGLCFIHPRALVRNPRFISLGRNVVLEDGCEVQGAAKRGVQLGDQVTVGRLAMIRPSGYYGRELGEGLRVGNRSNIGAFAYIGCAGFIDIGENVLMGPRVGLFAENHVFADSHRPMREQGVTRQGIVIEDDCWLGTACSILDGVRVGRGSVVAAGSVVTRDVPPMSVVAGVPAKVIKTREV